MSVKITPTVNGWYWQPVYIILSFLSFLPKTDKMYYFYKMPYFLIEIISTLGKTYFCENVIVIDY